MALRAAVANGNWSNPATWNNGVLPVAGDVIASNGFTVTINQDINVDLLTNTVQSPVIITPIMTSNTAPSGIVSASAYYGNNPTFLPFNAFRRTSGDWLSEGPTGWIAYEFPTLKTVDQYQILPPGNGTPSSVPRNWTFEAWDGTAWIILDTVTGNSGTATVTRLITNTTAYIKYRINITANNGNGSYSGINELYLYEKNDFAANSVAGGGFILNSGVTVTTTGTTGLSAGSSSLIDFQSNGTATINCGTRNIAKPTTSNTALYTIRVSGGGTLNVIGNISYVSSNSRTIIVNTTAGATLNFTGNIDPGSSTGIETLVNCTVNIIGNIYGIYASNGPVAAVDFTANGTLNITGNIFGPNGFNNNGFGVRMGLGNLNITGNLYGSTNNAGINAQAVSIANNATVYITGNIYGGTSLVGSGHWGLSTGSIVYLNQVGGIFAGYNIGGLISTNGSAINLFSGPFVCNEYGFFPYQVLRMHLIPTITSYFEFRDETTNGAIQPGAIAPATRLVSPASVSDGPAVGNVRFGTTYALGTLTGTLRMPHPNQVTYGVAVDNTFGNAVLTAASVWDYLVSNITVENSIGMRLKNVSTPQTTGEQLEAFLRLE